MKKNLLFIAIVFLVTSISYSQKIKWNKDIAPLLENKEYSSALSPLKKLVEQKNAIEAYYQLGFCYYNLYFDNYNNVYCDSSLYYFEYFKSKVYDFDVAYSKKFHPDFQGDSETRYKRGLVKLSTRINNLKGAKKQYEEKELAELKLKEDSIIKYNYYDKSYAELLERFNKIGINYSDSVLDIKKPCSIEEYKQLLKYTEQIYKAYYDTLDKRKNECTLAYYIYNSFVITNDYNHWDDGLDKQSYHVRINTYNYMIEEFNRKYKSALDDFNNEFDALQRKQIAIYKCPKCPKNSVKQYFNAIIKSEGKTIKKLTAKNCVSKFIFRDIYSMNDNEIKIFEDKLSNKYGKMKLMLSEYSELIGSSKTLYLKNNSAVVIFKEKKLMIGLVFENNIWKIVGWGDSPGDVCINNEIEDWLWKKLKPNTGFGKN